MKQPNWNALQTYQPRKVGTQNQRRSAVLIPILDLPDYPILYTQRSFQLKNHAGQISFPGGVVESGETAWEAALREAQEEVGIPPEKVQRMGQIDDVYSPRGFHIRCMVGLVQPFQVKLNEWEVTRILTVPFAELFEAAYHQILPWKHFQVHFFHFPAGLVWGVTGQITECLRQSQQSMP